MQSSRSYIRCSTHTYFHLIYNYGVVHNLTNKMSSNLSNDQMQSTLDFCSFFQFWCVLVSQKTKYLLKGMPGETFVHWKASDHREQLQTSWTKKRIPGKSFQGKMMRVPMRFQVQNWTKLTSLPTYMGERRGSPRETFVGTNTWRMLWHARK